MVVEEQKEQWRVPPIKDNHTVDIFTEPEYFQVYIVWTSYMICLLGCVLGVVGKQETAKSDCTQDIYRYLKQSEVKHLPKWNYMAKQTDITHSMRYRTTSPPPFNLTHLVQVVTAFFRKNNFLELLLGFQRTYYLV